MSSFRIRLNYIDHYLATSSCYDPPLTKDGFNLRSRVPVIRVFGATPSGQKACIHVHGMFPYLYIEYEGLHEADAAEVYISRMHLSMDNALGVSFRRQPGFNQPSFIAHISLVKGTPFYGYHVGYKPFLKVYLFNPAHIVRLADLLRQGAIMGKAFQPYESHMQYVPQWMCDFNLFGCDYMECRPVYFREPVPSQDEVQNPTHDWHDGRVGRAMMADASLPRQSHCALEVDVCVHDILNRLEVRPREIHHTLREVLTSSQMDDKLVTSMAGLWRDETRRRKSRMGLRNSDTTPFPPEVLVSVSADPRDSQVAGWVHEEEYREKLRQLIGTEGNDAHAAVLTQVATPSEFLKTAQTAYESIGDLFPKPSGAPRADSASNPLAMAMARDDITVDEPQAGLYDPDLQLDEIDAELDEIFGKRPATLPPSAEQSTEDVTLTRSQSVDSDAHGIRLAGDYENEELDAFEIPPGFTSDISGTIEKMNLAKRRASDEARENKRRKIPKISFANDPLERTFRDAPGISLTINDKASSGESPSVETYFQQPPPSAQPQPWYSPIVSETDGRISDKGPRRTPGPLDEPSFEKLSQDLKLSAAAESLQSDLETENSAESAAAQLLKVASTVASSFSIQKPSNLFLLDDQPPKSDMILDELAQSGLPSVVYNEPYYGREEDVPERSRVYGGREFKLPGITLPYLPEFDHTGRAPFSNRHIQGVEQRKGAAKANLSALRTWEIRAVPPTREEVEDWLRQEKSVSNQTTRKNTDSQLLQLSQIDAATQKGKLDFNFSQKKSFANITAEAQYMSVMSVEIHVNTRGELLPDPEKDEVVCVFWCLQSESGGEDLDGTYNELRSGIIILANPDEKLSKQVHFGNTTQVTEETNELDLLNKVIDIVRQYDPDILTGFEVHDSSWGYLIERAGRKYEFNLCDELSRVRTNSHSRFGKSADRWGFEKTSTIRITGRHVINIWRALRGEIDLLQYTMENIAFHVLQQRIPHYPFVQLTKWYTSTRPYEFSRVLDYWLSRAKLDLEILERNELIPRTSEQARLLGVDFYAVFARGSQFKVESLMMRIAKPESMILVSPSRKQVGQQNALECIPMVMEPQSAFYTSPVLVLDFQSLYPSVMIAYNYCYSTFLGRVVPWRGQNKMGFTDFARQPGLLQELESQINIAPNGMMYTRPEVRKSLLAKMLGEILETRVMVKSGMKVDTEDRQLQRLLNNRQLALKLIANVTYGYTSASFSGRMPCVEIADSIVQTGRETLERSIALIHSVKKWRAEVVYGDTDSLFILLHGRTRDQAFDIGEEIAQTITDMNPRPVKLKFEKVYHPCVLLAKKRYVGFKYEHRNQMEPEFDAKGIETVRRDGTPAEQKIEETALKMLFRTADLSQIKAYVQRQCTKIMQGRVSVQDFCFAKEVKLGTYSDRGPAPPGALVATRKMLFDPRAEPQYGERVPYVVIAGAPGARLIDRCVAPEVLLRSNDNELDAEYYITKNILPPLERIFNLFGANVRGWYDEMPKIKRIRQVAASVPRPAPNLQGNVRGGPGNGGLGKWLLKTTARKTLESYMRASTCVACRAKLEANGSNSTVPRRRPRRRLTATPVQKKAQAPRAGYTPPPGFIPLHKIVIRKDPPKVPSLSPEVPLCSTCRADPAVTLGKLQLEVRGQEQKAVDLHRICRSCTGAPWGDEIGCDSRDCPVFYERVRHMARLANRKAVVAPVIEALAALPPWLEW